MADKQFDLAIVDPPYGIGMDGTIGIGIGIDVFGYTCLFFSPIVFPFYLGIGFDNTLEKNEK